MYKLDILVSTYNGEKYIREQLDSLLFQSETDFRVLIRDDGSGDSTVQIIRSYQTQFPDRIFLVNDDLGNVGCALSFMELMARSDAEYLMFCDQDDVWRSEKVSNSLSKIKELEKVYGSGVPLLVFSDLTVVNERLETIYDSFWARQKLDISITRSWKNLLAQNVITGCTMIINKAAVVVVRPMGHIGVLHDQWIAVHVAKFGRIDYIAKPLVLYRQHLCNVEGVKNIGVGYMIMKLLSLRRLLQVYKDMAAVFEVGVIEILFRKVLLNVKRLSGCR